VEGNPVFAYHDAFNPDRAQVDALKDRYRRGAVGDAAVKDALSTALNRFLEPVRARRAALKHEDGLVERVLHAGTTRMQAEARQTLEMVRSRTGIGTLWDEVRTHVAGGRR
jgi:tryptophanyl-tRNA synthetase